MSLLTCAFVSGRAGVSGSSVAVVTLSSSVGLQHFSELWLVSPFECAATEFLPLKTGRGAMQAEVDLAASLVVLAFDLSPPVLT